MTARKGGFASGSGPFRLSSGASDEPTTRRSHIAPNFREIGGAPDLANFFSVFAGATEILSGGSSRFWFRHTCIAVLCRQLVEVKRELDVDRGFVFAPTEESAAPRPESPEVFSDELECNLGNALAHSMLSTLLTAEAKDSQCAFSTSSSFRPVRVRR